jgi:hypothetical protein
MPERVVDVSCIEQHEAPPDVFVDVEQVISQITHARFLIEIRMGIKALAVIPPGERREVAFGPSQFS